MSQPSTNKSQSPLTGKRAGRLKASDVVFRLGDAAKLQAAAPEELGASLMEIHTTIKATKRIGVRGLKRLLKSATAAGSLVQLAETARAGLDQADSLREFLPDAGRFSFMSHAVANEALRQQGPQATARNIEGLSQILAPAGMTLERVTKMANRHPQYYLTSPEQAQERIDEICGYFDGKLKPADLIKAMGNERRSSYLPLTLPAGHATGIFEWMRTSLEVDKDKLLKMVLYYPGILAKPEAELKGKLTALTEQLEEAFVPGYLGKRIIAADLTSLCHNTTDMGGKFLSLRTQLSPYGMTAVGLAEAITKCPRILSSRTETVLDNICPIFERLKARGEPPALYVHALRAQPMLMLCGNEYVWNNYLVVRASAEDGYMDTAQARAKYPNVGARALSNPLALAFATEQLALRRVWARQVKGGSAVNNFLKTPIKTVQAELQAKLGAAADLSALAQAELNVLAKRLGHDFNRQSASPKPFGKKAKAEAVPA